MNEMICTCDIEGVRNVEARRLRIFHRMGLSYMEDLTTAIVISLAFDFQASVDVYADMWFGVSLTTPLVTDASFVECDCPEDGLALLWEELAEDFPERVSVKQNVTPMNVRITERISTALFSDYENAETKYLTHRASSHKDDNDISSCEDCSVFMNLSIMKHSSLNDAWGARVLEPTLDKVFDS